MFLNKVFLRVSMKAKKNKGAKTAKSTPNASCLYFPVLLIVFWSVVLAVV